MIWMWIVSIYFGVNLYFLLDAAHDGVFKRMIKGGKQIKSSNFMIVIAIVWQALEIIFLALPEFVIKLWKNK